MALTPQDIQSQQFHVRFRGFDVDEVDDFLEKVAEDYLTAIQENKQLKERLEEMRNDLSTYRGQEKSFQKAFVSAQQMADDMMEKSEKEAAEIVDGAKEEAEQLLAAAHEEIVGLEKQLDQLKSRKNKIHEELRATLTSYLERLDEVFEGEAAEAADSFSHAGETVTLEEEDSFPDQMAAEEGEEEDDLYTKVDLTDDFRLPEEDEFPSDDDSDATFSMPGKEEEQMPDLEGEMVFSLDDPLDDLAPDIKIGEDDPEQR